MTPGEVVANIRQRDEQAEQIRRYRVLCTDASVLLEMRDPAPAGRLCRRMESPAPAVGQGRLRAADLTNTSSRPLTAASYGSAAVAVWESGFQEAAGLRRPDATDEWCKSLV